MRPEELRAGAALAAIFGLRMLGLFLILPVFSVWARSIPGGSDLTLVGLALGAYGLTQALLQIPFGMASDRLGRKKVIVFGLLLFAAGSAIAGLAGNIYTTILGRCLQGGGAISAAVTALAADLTREQHRTKVMAMIGSSIGLVFAGSLVLAPLLYSWIGMSGIFLLTGALALGAIALVTLAVPEPPELVVPDGGVARFRQVLGDPQLMRLNFGIFALHLAQMAMFVVVPGALVAAGGLPVPEHWKIYLPVVLASFVLMLPAIIAAEKRGRMMKVFVGAILLLLASQVGFLLGGNSFTALVAMLLVFFVAFNILEASLPSLISRIAPPKSKGTALGIYNTTQSLGLFLGGSIGGALAQHVGSGAVFAFGAAVIGMWLALAVSMRPPPVLALREFSIPQHLDVERIKRQLAELPGVREAVVDKRTAYLKVNMDRWDERLAQRVLGGEI
jgi:MFS family permease